MTNVESMDHTHFLSSTIASLSSTPNSRRYHTPTIYLPQNSHHTCLLWQFHSHFEIYGHANFHQLVYYDTLHHCHIPLHDHVADIVFVEKPLFIILSHVTLDSLHNKYIAGGIHIESYLVLSIEL